MNITFDLMVHCQRCTWYTLRFGCWP